MITAATIIPFIIEGDICGFRIFIGFGLPLAAIMLGVSFGKLAIKAKRAEAAIRIAAGVLLIAAGFYFLATL